jgi:hypothetical protein
MVYLRLGCGELAMDPNRPKDITVGNGCLFQHFLLARNVTCNFDEHFAEKNDGLLFHYACHGLCICVCICH